MKHLSIDILLVLAVAFAWLAALGLTRLRTPLDRLHAITFVNVTCGGAILAAALIEDGFTDRVFKILLILAINLLSGAGISHATARALQWREKA